MKTFRIHKILVPFPGEKERTSRLPGEIRLSLKSRPNLFQPPGGWLPMNQNNLMITLLILIKKKKVAYLANIDEND